MNCDEASWRSSNRVKSKERKSSCLKTMEPTDDTIIENVLNGNTEAYRFLVERYQRQIFNLMYRYSRNDEDAADLTQEAFVKAFMKLKQYRSGNRFFSWLYSLAVNLARDWCRKKSRQQTVRHELNNHSMVIDRGASVQQEKLEYDQEILLLQQALDRLPDETREIVLLRYRQEMPIKEVTAIFGLGESAVKMRLSRALQQLRNIMHEDGRNEER